MDQCWPVFLDSNATLQQSSSFHFQYREYCANSVQSGKWWPNSSSQTPCPMHIAMHLSRGTHHLASISTAFFSRATSKVHVLSICILIKVLGPLFDVSWVKPSNEYDPNLSFHPLKLSIAGLSTQRVTINSLRFGYLRRMSINLSKLGPVPTPASSNLWHSAERWCLWPLER
jgi:hypothetical protein